MVDDEISGAAYPSRRHGGIGERLKTRINGIARWPSREQWVLLPYTVNRRNLGRQEHDRFRPIDHRRHDRQW